MLKLAQRTGDGALDLINAATLDIANYAMAAAHRISHSDDYSAAKDAQKFLKDFVAKCADTNTTEYKWGDRLNKAEIHGKSLMNGNRFWTRLDALANKDFPAAGAPSIEFRDLQDACVVLIRDIGNLKYRITSGLEDMAAEHVTPLRVLLQ